MLFCPGRQRPDDINSRTAGNLWIIITVILTPRGSGRRLQIGTGRIGVSRKEKLKTTRELKGRFGLLTMEAQPDVSKACGRRASTVAAAAAAAKWSQTSWASQEAGWEQHLPAPRVKNCNRLVHTGSTDPRVSLQPGCVSRVLTGNTFCTSEVLMWPDAQSHSSVWRKNLLFMTEESLNK